MRPALGSTTPTRAPYAPEVPTVDESGVKGFDVVTLKDCTATLSEEEQYLAIEKNYPMFSRPMEHEAFLQEIEGQETAQGQASGRGYSS